MQPVPEPTTIVVEDTAAMKKLTALWLKTYGSDRYIYPLIIRSFPTFPCAIDVQQFGNCVMFKMQEKRVLMYRGKIIALLTGPVKYFFRNAMLTDGECVVANENTIRSVMFMRDGECKTMQTACGLDLTSLVKGELRPRIQGSILVYGCNVVRLATLIWLARRGKLPLPRELLIEIVRHIDLGDVTFGFKKD